MGVMSMYCVKCRRKFTTDSVDRVEKFTRGRKVTFHKAPCPTCGTMSWKIVSNVKAR